MTHSMNSRAGIRRSNSRRLLATLAFLVALPVDPAEAAQVQVSRVGLGDGVGEPVQIGLTLAALGGEGPGDVSIVLEWGLERSEFFPYTLGALRLEASPSILDSTATTSLSDDCLAVGALAGRCDLAFSFAEPTQAGAHPLASLDFTYLWVPEPGFELCVVGEVGCIEAVEQVEVRIASTVFGGPTFYDFIPLGTFGGPGVRPIPEPSTATLIGLGLLLLARPGESRRTGAGRDGARVSGQGA